MSTFKICRALRITDLPCAAVQVLNGPLLIGISSCAISSMHMTMRQPMRFTRHRPFLVFVRVREGALFASVSARPHPKAAGQDRSDTVGRRRALPPWRAYNGPRQATCAWLQVVLRH